MGTAFNNAAVDHDADTLPGVGVVVVAGGSGTRLGAVEPKAFVSLDGRPLLDWALTTICRLPELVGVVAVVPDAYADREHAAFGSWLSPRVRLVTGGAQRADSVRAGLAVLPDCDVVLVHDAARCLTPLAVFERVIAAVRAGDAGVVPGLPVVDTMKVVDADGFVTGTADRETLRAVQTPQGFAGSVLRAAHRGGGDATDDAGLVEQAGYAVRVVPGDPAAFKVTTPADLAAAQRLLEQGWRP